MSAQTSLFGAAAPAQKRAPRVAPASPVPREALGVRHERTPGLWVPTVGNEALDHLEQLEVAVRAGNVPVLAVRQPWARLICLGLKPIENRTWLPRRDTLEASSWWVLILASKGEDESETRAIMSERMLPEPRVIQVAAAHLEPHADADPHVARVLGDGCTIGDLQAFALWQHDQHRPERAETMRAAAFARGAIIGAVRLSHVWPWERRDENAWADCDGRTVHWPIITSALFHRPVAVRGQLGLFAPSPECADELAALCGGEFAETRLNGVFVGGRVYRGEVSAAARRALRDEDEVEVEVDCDDPPATSGVAPEHAEPQKRRRGRPTVDPERASKRTLQRRAQAARCAKVNDQPSAPAETLDPLRLTDPADGTRWTGGVWPGLTDGPGPHRVTCPRDGCGFVADRSMKAWARIRSEGRCEVCAQRDEILR